MAEEKPQTKATLAVECETKEASLSVIHVYITAGLCASAGGGGTNQTMTHLHRASVSYGYNIRPPLGHKEADKKKKTQQTAGRI